MMLKHPIVKMPYSLFWPDCLNIMDTYQSRTIKHFFKMLALDFMF